MSNVQIFLLFCAFVAASIGLCLVMVSKEPAPDEEPEIYDDIPRMGRE